MTCVKCDSPICSTWADVTLCCACVTPSKPSLDDPVRPCSNCWSQSKPACELCGYYLKEEHRSGVPEVGDTPMSRTRCCKCEGVPQDNSCLHCYSEYPSDERCNKCYAQLPKNDFDEEYYAHTCKIATDCSNGITDCCWHRRAPASERCCGCEGMEPGDYFKCAKCGKRGNEAYGFCDVMTEFCCLCQGLPDACESCTGVCDCEEIYSEDCGALRRGRNTCCACLDTEPPCKQCAERKNK